MVDATMTGFAPNDTVTLWWPDGLMLGQGTTDGAGNAVITLPDAALSARELHS